MSAERRGARRRVVELSAPDDVDRELEFHVQMRADELRAQGWSEEEARREARRLLGDRREVRTRMIRISRRQQRRRRWRIRLDRLRQDLRFAFRTFRRSPGFTLTVLAVLSLAIGANVAIFSAANAALFRPLPFGAADELFMLYETNPDYGWVDATAAPANLLDWSEQVDAFEGVSGYADFLDRPTLLRDGRPIAVGQSAVLGDFFEVLGVTPMLGRRFRVEETWEGADGVAILSHGLWTREFGADPGVVGRRIELSTGSREVVGVMPPGFSFPSSDTELWVPFGWPPEARSEAWFRRAHFVRAFARLAPGATPEAADAELQAVAGRLEADHPDTNTRMGAGMAPIRDFLAREVRGQLLVLLGAVVLLLLLAGANVANLMFVRGRSRIREVGIRTALGADRGRILAQLGTESLLVATVAGAIGLGLGWLGVRAVERIQPLGLAGGVTSLAIDLRVIGFTVAIAGLCALAASIWPSWRLVRKRDTQGIGGSDRGGTSDRRGRRTVQALVGLEVATALVLVAGAALMVRSYTALRAVDPGFAVDSIVALQVRLPDSRYGTGEEVNAFHDRLLATLEGRGGITSAGTVEALPLAGPSWSSQFQAEGWPPDRIGFEVLHRRADAGYFETLGIPLRRGRMFTSSDRDGSLVVLVNEAFAREHFPDEDPIGQRIAFSREATPESTWYEIIGIVGNQRQESLATPARAEVFENRHQEWGRENWIVLKVSGDPGEATVVARTVMSELDPLLPPAEARSLAQVWSLSVGRERLVLTLLALFGGTAFVLAVVGVYGVTAESTRRRTREIGIRMAMGAGGREVMRMVLGQGLGVVAVGLAAGLAAAFASTRALNAFLYDVAPGDPMILGLVTLLLGGAASLASYLPARRATRIEPTRSLRID